MLDEEFNEYSEKQVDEPKEFQDYRRDDFNEVEDEKIALKPEKKASKNSDVMKNISMAFIVGLSGAVVATSALIEETITDNTNTSLIISEVTEESVSFSFLTSESNVRALIYNDFEKQYVEISYQESEESSESYGYCFVEGLHDNTRYTVALETESIFGSTILAKEGIRTLEKNSEPIIDDGPEGDETPRWVTDVVIEYSFKNLDTEPQLFFELNFNGADISDILNLIFTISAPYMEPYSEERSLDPADHYIRIDDFVECEEFNVSISGVTETSEYELYSAVINIAENVPPTPIDQIGVTYYTQNVNQSDQLVVFLDYIDNNNDYKGFKVKICEPTTGKNCEQDFYEGLHYGLVLNIGSEMRGVNNANLEISLLNDGPELIPVYSEQITLYTTSAIDDLYMIYDPYDSERKQLTGYLHRFYDFDQYYGGIMFDLIPYSTSPGSSSSSAASSGAIGNPIEYEEEGITLYPVGDGPYSYRVSKDQYMAESDYSIVIPFSNFPSYEYYKIVASIVTADGQMPNAFDEQIIKCNN